MKTKTLKFRVKDKHAKQLCRMAVSVNQVWNYINDLSHTAIKREGRFFSAYDLQNYTKGTSKDLGLSSQSVQMVSAEYVNRRNQFKKSKLRWRKSLGSKRSLGWVPVSGQSLKYVNGQIKHNGTYFSFWDSYGLGDYKLRAGSFNEDARGRWYFNVCVDVEAKESKGTGAVGIDLGCKATATDSNGDGVVGREYRKLEEKLGIAQRAKNKKQVKTIHAKIKNRRASTLHEYSRKLVDANAAIFVGNVSSLGLAKTKMAKSVLDAGWSQLKSMLEYKSDNANIVFKEVNEAYTTQSCSCCGSISDSSPKGRAGLNKRNWTCDDCGSYHDRDINAAMNIRALGLESLVGGALCVNA